MTYEWDESKRRSNIAKHGYDLAWGDLVYEAPGKVTIESHRSHEHRWLDIAEIGGELVVLTLTYTRRGEAIRFISLRPASRKERSIYYGKDR